MKRFLALVAAPLLVAGLGGVALVAETNPAKLGQSLVEHLGCLYCHGLGGRQGIENPNAVRKYVPAWDEKAFAERYPTPEKVRDTIKKGRFPDRDPKANGNPIPMPPWGNRLTDPELDAIIAYIWSLRETPMAAHAKGGLGGMETEEESAPESPLTGLMRQRDDMNNEPKAHVKPPGADNPVQLGHDLVDHLGCLYCHGLGGREGIENPNAVRKHVPAWDSEEFVRRYPVDDGVRYVIEKGRTPAKDPKAEGSPIPMPPWGNRLTKDEMDAVVAYIWSLRKTPVAAHPKGGLGGE